MLFPIAGAFRMQPSFRRIAAVAIGNALEFYDFLVFGFFAAMMALQFVLVWRFLPETKGVTLEAMEQRLGGH